MRTRGKRRNVNMQDNLYEVLEHIKRVCMHCSTSDTLPIINIQLQPNNV